MANNENRDKKLVSHSREAKRARDKAARKQNSMVRDALILFAITLIAGLLLAGVYALTKDPIAYQNEKIKQDAYRQVLAEADSFEEDEQLSTLVTDAQSVLDTSTTDFKGAYIDSAVVAYDVTHHVIGYVVNATATSGYGGDIKLSIGFDKEGVITGVSILDINETAGLGMNAKKESFREQYVGHAVDAFTVTKTGKREESEIDAITSATITSRAMTSGVNAALYFVKQAVLPGMEVQ